MASLWKHPQSKYWVACYTDRDGRQRKKSTKISATEKNRAKALRLADEMENAHKLRLTETKIRELADDLVKDILGKETLKATVRGCLTSYLKQRDGEVSFKTMEAYRQVNRDFLAWLGPAADDEISRIEKDRILSFRKHLRERVKPATVNKTLKILKVMFKAARRDGFMSHDPFDAVEAVAKAKEAETQRRRPFKLDELRVLMREIQGTEWESLVRLGLYTGQRLGDLAALRWSQVNLQADEVTITTQKTGRVVLVPICATLREHLLSLAGGDDANGLLHPRAGALGVNHLSREFGEILARCGFRAKASHRKMENRDAERRRVNELTFHSLRHTAVSMMKNAGISPAIVQDLVGHESAEMSAHYTHIESDAKRKALAALPVI